MAILSLMGLHSTPRQGSLQGLKPCPIWIGKIIVENEVVQYWTPWELFETQLFKKATVIFQHEKRKYIEQQKNFEIFFSFYEPEFWTATSRRRRVNNQISYHLALDRNGVLSYNRCSVLREFLARKLVVYHHAASSFFIIILINTSHLPA